MLFISVLLPFSLAAGSEFRPIAPDCESIYVTEDFPISLASMERKLACGDPSVAEWRKVPLGQSERQVRISLQASGFHHPKISSKSGRIYVESGPRTVVRDIKIFFKSSDPSLQLTADSRFLEAPLTPALLDELEAWVKALLARRGYPCIAVQSSANSDQGTIHISVENAKRRRITSISASDVSELQAAALKRFYAVAVPEFYNLDFIELSNVRVRESGLSASSYFLEDCSEDNIQLRHKFTVGDSRLLRLGVGANTEELGIFRAQWSNTRTDTLGSSLSFRLRISPKKQSFLVDYDWYYSEANPRHHIAPSFELKRVNARKYESLDLRMAGFWKNSWDFSEGELRFGLGPVGNLEQLIDGVGPRRTTFLSLDIELSYMSHYFELNRNEPKAGFYTSLGVSATNDLVLSPISATLFEWSFTYLYNVWDRVHPPLILGLRGRFATTKHSRSNNPISELPVSFRQFLGGSNSIRGFAKDSIPNDPLGNITSAYLGIEARTTAFPHPKLQPFIFADFGGVSNGSFAVSAPYYWSPGAGLRWSSPVGAFRFSAAKGFLIHSSQIDKASERNLQFYIGFGEEF